MPTLIDLLPVRRRRQPVSMPSAPAPVADTPAAPMADVEEIKHTHVDLLTDLWRAVTSNDFPRAELLTSAVKAQIPNNGDAYPWYKFTDESGLYKYLLISALDQSKDPRMVALILDHCDPKNMAWLNSQTTLMNRRSDHLFQLACKADRDAATAIIDVLITHGVIPSQAAVEYARKAGLPESTQDLIASYIPKPGDADRAAIVDLLRAAGSMRSRMG